MEEVGEEVMVVVGVVVVEEEEDKEEDTLVLVVEVKRSLSGVTLTVIPLCTPSLRQAVLLSNFLLMQGHFFNFVLGFAWALLVAQTNL